jgi:DNA-binding transcriptional LysR family regulator
MTLKQLHAFLWVCRLGSFGAAAKKIHATQSTVSARIIELETSLGVPLFDRSGQSARLTAKGRELLPLAERMLGTEAQIRSSVADPEALSGTLRVGVAEFIALSWLPDWVGAANRRFPNVVLEIDVDLTLALHEKLANGRLDMALLPGPTPDPDLVQKPLGAVEFVWMASPALGVPRKLVGARELEPFPIIMLSYHSNLHAILRNWFEVEGVTPRRVDICNSLATVASLTIAGLGVSFLPKRYHAGDVQQGRLQVINTRPKIVPLQYVAAYRADRPSPLSAALASLAMSVSSYDKTAIPQAFEGR